MNTPLKWFNQTYFTRWPLWHGHGFYRAILQLILKKPHNPILGSAFTLADITHPAFLLSKFFTISQPSVNQITHT